MRKKLLLGAAALVMSLAAQAQVWATAIATNPSTGHVIVYRFIKELAPGFRKASQPDRVLIAWSYQGERGMPAVPERQRMDAMEDALDTRLNGGRVASLAVVSTGRNLRQWVYYAQSSKDFEDRLDQVLKDMPGLTIETRSERDPEWKTYESFKATLK